MTRKQLEDLGLTKEQMDTIMELNGKDIENTKASAKGKDDEIAALNEQIKTANDTIAELKKNNVDNEALQKKVGEYEGEVKRLKAEAEATTKTYALKEQLSKAGVVDADYLIYKHGGIDKFTFDKEGKPVGIEETLKPYKEDTTMAHLFKQEPVKQQYNPKDGSGAGAVNPFAKETYNLTKQGELLRSNPEQARAMAAAAGVTI